MNIINKYRMKYTTEELLHMICKILQSIFYILMITVLILVISKLHTIDKTLYEQNLCLSLKRPDVATDIENLKMTLSSAMRRLEARMLSLDNRVEDTNYDTSGKILVINDLLQEKILNEMFELKNRVDGLQSLRCQ